MSFTFRHAEATHSLRNRCLFRLTHSIGCGTPLFAAQFAPVPHSSVSSTQYPHLYSIHFSVLITVNRSSYYQSLCHELSRTNLLQVFAIFNLFLSGGRWNLLRWGSLRTLFLNCYAGNVKSFMMTTSSSRTASCVSLGTMSSERCDYRYFGSMLIIVLLILCSCKAYFSRISYQAVALPALFLSNLPGHQTIRWCGVNDELLAYLQFGCIKTYIFIPITCKQKVRATKI